MSPRITLTPLTIDNAEPAARTILEATRVSMGAVPNMYGAMANLSALLDTYTHGYQQFRAGSGLDPVEQEVVFLAISRRNGCAYCIAAHSFVADHLSHVPAEVTDAIRHDTPVPDTKLAALADFTRHMVDTRGLADPDRVNAFLAAGYRDHHVLAVVLGIAVKTLSNYTNHLFDTPVDAMFAARSWTPGAVTR